MKTHLFFYFFIFSCNQLIAQPLFEMDHKIPVDLLKEDLSTLKENLELAHTGLYTYHSKEEFDQFFENTKNNLREPMTSLEFYRAVRPLLSLIRNGHTGIQPSRMYVEKIRDEWALFPLDLYWYDGQLYVYRNLSDEVSIPRGAVLKSINGENANLLYQEFAEHVSSDGFNTTAKIDEAWSNFKVLYVYLRGIPDQFEVEVQTPDGQLIKRNLSGKTNADLSALRKKQMGRAPKSFYASPDIPALELNIEGDVATMRIRSFDKKFVKKEKGQKFKKFYKKAFQQIEAAGVNHLIIDVRGNGGGDPMPTIELFAHLHPEPFTFYKDVYALRKKIPNKKLYTDLDFATKNIVPLAFSKKGNYYRPNWLARMLGLKGLKESKPNQPYYDKKVYVLTNSGSFSATGELTGIIKNYDRAIFIGEEAGGNPVKNVSGIVLTLQLPHTKTRVFVPFWMWEMNVDFENTGHGVIPDHIVRRSLQDRIDGKDTAMEYTLDLINQ